MSKYNELKNLLKYAGIKYEFLPDGKFELFVGNSILTVSENSLNGKEIGFDNVIEAINKIITVIDNQEKELNFFVSFLLSNTLEK